MKATRKPTRPEAEIALWFKNLRKQGMNLSQRELSERTGIPLGTVRHFEQTGRIGFPAFLLLAGEVGALDSILALARNEEPLTFHKIQNTITNTDKTFWDAHGRVGLVWSNPNASNDVLIAAALLRRPNFHLLLDIAAHFGLDRLKDQWARLKEGIETRQYPEELKQIQRAQPIVERCLTTMEEAVCPKN